MRDDDPITRIENHQAIRDIAGITRIFYESLVDEGFSPVEALSLTTTYIRGIATPSSSA